MQTVAKQENFMSRPIELSQILLGGLFLFTALSGFLPQTYLSMAIVLCFGVLMLNGDIYLGFPFVLFYNAVYGVVMGLSVWRIYSLMLLADLVIRKLGKATIKGKYLLPLMVYVFFLVLVMMPHNLREGIFLLVDIVCVLFIALEFCNDESFVKRFFRIYTLVAILSYVTGVAIGNTIGDEYNYVRFNATFEDPNYMGFFFTIAVFSTISLKLFPKVWRFVIVIALYVMMMASLSMTAILVNVVMWLFYLLITKKIKPMSIVAIIVVLLVLVSLYSYGLENPETAVLGDLSARIEEKLESLESGDISDVTTGRSSLSKRNLKYYLSQSVFKMLFGGTSVNARYVHPDVRAVSHNEYVDLLLNVGIVGALIMIGYFLHSYWQPVKRFLSARKDSDLCIVMIKTVWLFYSFTLTMFIDFRFMLMFLI